MLVRKISLFMTAFIFRVYQYYLHAYKYTIENEQDDYFIFTETESTLTVIYTLLAIKSMFMWITLRFRINNTQPLSQPHKLSQTLR